MAFAVMACDDSERSAYVIPACILGAEGGPDAFDDVRRRRFIDTDADSARRLIVGADTPQIDSPLQRAFDDCVLPTADIDRDRIEVMRRQHVPAAVLQTARQRRGGVRDAQSDLP